MFVLSLLFFLPGCSVHEVNTFEGWCEQITGVDLIEKYAPFWALLPGVTFRGDEIRDDYTDFLNGALLEKVENRAPRMAWRERADLHIVNLSGFFVVDPGLLISEWRNGIELDLEGKHKDPADVCFYGTLTSMFDNLYIHSMVPSAVGSKRTDTVTAISTQREQRLGDRSL
jgi:hypothetical protein